MHSLFRMSLTALILALSWTSSGAQTEKQETLEHYTNEQVNPDSDFIPGPYPETDSQAAIQHYNERVDALDPDGEMVLDVQKEETEITWKAIKNETASVLGYFRTFDGYLSFENGKFNKAELLVSVNSLDSAVPGRDNRIKTIFFESMKTEMSTGVLVLDKIINGSPYLSAIQNGAPHELVATGLFTLGTATLPVTVNLQAKWDKERETLSIETSKPLTLLISDLGLKKNAPTLMKECNHKSLGNAVEINCKLKFE